MRSRDNGNANREGLCTSAGRPWSGQREPGEKEENQKFKGYSKNSKNQRCEGSHLRRERVRCPRREDEVVKAYRLLPPVDTHVRRRHLSDVTLSTKEEVRVERERERKSL